MSADLSDVYISDLQAHLTRMRALYGDVRVSVTDERWGIQLLTVDGLSGELDPFYSAIVLGVD